MPARTFTEHAIREPIDGRLVARCEEYKDSSDYVPHRAGLMHLCKAWLTFVVSVTACEAPSPRVPHAKAVDVRATVAARAHDIASDVPAGDSATFGGRDMLAGDTVYSFADYHTASADIEHLERRTDSLVTVASLVLPVRYRNHIVLHACTVDGTPDPEILAIYPDDTREAEGDTSAVSPAANAFAPPRFAWRASRTRARFEIIDPRRVRCSFADVVD